MTHLPILAHRLLLALLLIASFQIATAQITVRVNEPKQQIVMMGADMERSAAALQTASNKEEIIKWVFQDIEGINYLRVVFDKHQELEKGQKNLTYYDKQIASMQQIQAVSPDIRFWATLKTDYDGYGRNNNLPDWIYTGEGYNGGKYDPKKLEVTDYAGFLADYLQIMYENKVPIYAISVVKEWSQVVDSKRSGELIRALKIECSRRKVPTPLFIGPAAWGVRGGIRDLTQIKELGEGNLYTGFSVHGYDKPTEANWKEAVKIAASMGHPLVNDETGLGSGGANHGKDSQVLNVVRNFIARARTYRAGIAGEVFFETWSRGINRETRSIYFKKGGAGERLRGYWLFKAFAEGIIFSYYIPSSSAGDAKEIETMAFRKSFHSTLWVMNETDTDFTDLEFNVDGTAIHGDYDIEVKTFRDDDPHLRGIDQTLKPTNGQLFKANIPSHSISRIQFKHLGFVPEYAPDSR